MVIKKHPTGTIDDPIHHRGRPSAQPSKTANQKMSPSLEIEGFDNLTQDRSISSREAAGQDTPF
jgi:hypothetical protein